MALQPQGVHPVPVGFRVAKNPVQAAQPLNSSLGGSCPTPGFLNSTANINGNMGVKAECKNNFQKLNKQSQMLYLHHHQGQGATQTTASLTAPEKHGIASNSFCVTKNNHLAQESRPSTTHLLGQQPLREKAQHELENRPQTHQQSEYQQFAVAGVSHNVPFQSQKRASKMFGGKDSSRRGSQDKPLLNTSQTHSMLGPPHQNNGTY